MTTKDLVAAMRHCADCGDCDECEYRYDGLVYTDECKRDLMRYAANELERLRKTLNECATELVKENMRARELEARQSKNDDWRTLVEAVPYKNPNAEYRCPKCGLKLRVYNE